MARKHDEEPHDLGSPRSLPAQTVRRAQPTGVTAPKKGGRRKATGWKPVLLNEASLNQRQEDRNRRLSRAAQIILAQRSSTGITLSRPSGGRKNTERSTPAFSYDSIARGSSGAANAVIEMVLGSRPACSAH